VDFSRDFIALSCDKGVLRFGEFVTKAGRLSPYFFNAGLFNDGASFGALCGFYARTLLSASLPCDMLFGPAYKGIPLVAGTAMRLAEHGTTCPSASTARKPRTTAKAAPWLARPCRSCGHPR
jgi:orotate phosphoribosyltransferase